ncbi:MAG: hypothetical protein JWQ71_4029 [Pedosphaera sp.]|nr:hypothetical protein [Pedosphaera sp.]
MRVVLFLLLFCFLKLIGWSQHHFPRDASGKVSQSGHAKQTFSLDCGETGYAYTVIVVASSIALYRFMDYKNLI